MDVSLSTATAGSRVQVDSNEMLDCLSRALEKKYASYLGACAIAIASERDLPQQPQPGLTLDEFLEHGELQPLAGGKASNSELQIWYGRAILREAEPSLQLRTAVMVSGGSVSDEMPVIKLSLSEALRLIGALRDEQRA